MFKDTIDLLFSILIQAPQMAIKQAKIDAFYIQWKLYDLIVLEKKVFVICKKQCYKDVRSIIFSFILKKTQVDAL